MFNQSLPELLPKTILSIEFGKYYNQYLPKTFFSTLESLNYIQICNHNDLDYIINNIVKCTKLKTITCLDNMTLKLKEILPNDVSIITLYL